MGAVGRYSLRNLLAFASVVWLLAGCRGGPPSGGSPPPPPSSQSMTIGGAPATTAHAGQAYAFTPNVSDPGGKSLTFSIAYMPPWASFNSSTGTLSGTPAATDVGSFANVAITVSDGSQSVSLAPFTITVQPPTLGSATLSWQAPTQRIDGTPLTNLAGFRIYYGNAIGTYPEKVVIANPGLNTYVIDNLPSGTYYFVTTAYDTAGKESAYSDPASKTIT